MKKILAFITSLSMCLSLLTTLSPAYAHEDDATGVSVEESVELMSVDPKEDKDREVIGTQKDNI